MCHLKGGVDINYRYLLLKFTTDLQKTGYVLFCIVYGFLFTINFAKLKLSEKT